MKLIKKLKEWRQKSTPMRTNTFNDLIEILKIEEAKKITASPIIKKDPHYRSVLDEKIQYFILFESKSSKGREIKYQWNSFPGLTSPTFNDYDSRLKSLSVILTANQGLKRIQEKLPYIETTLLLKGEPIGKDTYEQMHQNAKKYNIKPLDLN